MSFSQQIAQFGEKASGRVQEVRRGVVVKLFNAIILDTPVDEGRARGGWQISADSPAMNDSGRLDKSGREPMAEVAAAAKASDGDTPLFLSNNVPYIVPLENGSSKKAPEGMVRRNIVRFARLIKVELVNKTK